MKHLWFCLVAYPPPRPLWSHLSQERSLRRGAKALGECEITCAVKRRAMWRKLLVSPKHGVLFPVWKRVQCKHAIIGVLSQTWWRLRG